VETKKEEKKLENFWFLEREALKEKEAE